MNSWWFGSTRTTTSNTSISYLRTYWTRKKLPSIEVGPTALAWPMTFVKLCLRCYVLCHLQLYFLSMCLFHIYMAIRPLWPQSWLLNLSWVELSWVETLTLTFNPMRSMIMTYSHAKVQSQQSLGSEDRVETNGQTDGRRDGGDCITSLANAVGTDMPFTSTR